MFSLRIEISIASQSTPPPPDAQEEEESLDVLQRLLSDLDLDMAQLPSDLLQVVGTSVGNQDKALEYFPVSGEDHHALVGLSLSKPMCH